MAKGVALAWDLIARDAASPTFNRVAVAADRAAVSTRKAETGLRGFGKGAVAALGVLATIDFGVHAVKDAAQFQRAMLLVQTEAGASAAEVKDLSKQVLGLAGTVGQSPERLANSLYHVYSVGLRGKQAMGVVKIAAEGAQVGMADLEETTNALTSTVASGIPGVKNMSQAMGALVAIVGTGDMKFSDLNEALGSGLLAVVKGYGLSLRDVGAALATFGDNNIRGADAATALRMAVQSLAVPAAKGKGAIESIGLTMKTLQVDMQQGGLNKALNDLNDHLKKAGITGVQTGAFLTEAFGKRAGIGLSVLEGQIDRFNKKFADVGKGASGFASKWDATTHTAAVQFDRLRAQLEVFAISVGNRLLPAVTDVAKWLGDNIPHAVGVLRDVLTPLAHLVGDVLGHAWTVLGGTLRVVGSGLQSLGGFLAAHKALVTGVATAVLTMWAAYKGFAIAKAALVAVDLAMGRLAARAPQIGAAIASSFTGIGPAVAGVTVVLAAAIYEWQKHKNAAAATNAEIKADVDAVTEAIKQDSGAVGENTRAWIANHLQQSGAFDSAAKLGISLSTLTDAAEGNAAAVKTVYAAVNNGPKLTLSQYQHLLGGIVVGTNAIKKGTHAFKQNTEAQDANGGKVQQLTQYQKDLASAQKDVTVQIDGVTYAMKGQASEADVLNAAIARLSGDKNAVAESQLALKDSLNSATDAIKAQAKQYKDSGASLNANTVEGRKNLEWLHQQIDSINGVASAQIKAGASTKTVTDTLGHNEQALRNAAIAAGLNKDQVNALIKKYAAVPSDVETYIKAHSDQADTKILHTQEKIDKLTKQKLLLLKMDPKNHAVTEAIAQIDSDIRRLTSKTHPITLTLNVLGGAGVGKAVHDAVNNIPGHAAGGSVGDGYFTVGEQGPELGRKQGSKVEIFSNSHPKTKAALAGQSAKQGGGGVYIAEQNLTVQYPLEGGLSEALKELSRLSARKIREASIAGRAV